MKFSERQRNDRILSFRFRAMKFAQFKITYYLNQLAGCEPERTLRIVAPQKHGQISEKYDFPQRRRLFFEGYF